MQRRQVWQYLAIGFLIFWVIFAIILFTANIPFMVVSIALTTIAALSSLVCVLAWAYQNNL